jgi:hypothetical protein
MAENDPFEGNLSDIRIAGRLSFNIKKEQEQSTLFSYSL